MRSVGLVIAGILAWVFYHNRESLSKWITEFFGRSESSQSIESKETKIVQEEQKNNLGMKVPNLKTLTKPLEFLRTNQRFKEVDRDEKLVSISKTEIEEIRSRSVSPETSVSRFGSVVNSKVSSWNPIRTSSNLSWNV